MNEKTINHLGLIQSVIARMASNSFLIKGWSVTIVSALFALAANDTDKKYVLIAYFPIFIFMVLDGYFLSQERLFRRLYDKVRSQTGEPDFSMDTSVVEPKGTTWIDAIFSKTILLFHGILAGSVLIVMFLLQ